MEATMLMLSERDINCIVRICGADFIMDSLVSGIHRGFEEMHRGEILHARRLGFENKNNLVEWMPVRGCGLGVVLKLVSYFPENPASHSLPTVGALIARADLGSGQITEVCEARLLTAMRTGAASAVASRLLAPARSATLGLVGCGCQAVTQAHALSRAFRFERIIAFDTDPAAAASLPGRLEFLSIPVFHGSCEEIANKSDIICVATTAPVGCDPVLGLYDMLEHVHINAVGSDFPGKKELDPRLVNSAFVTADLLEQAKKEGECQSLNPVRTEAPYFLDLSSLVGQPNDFSSLQCSRSIFDSTGIAMEDAVALNIFCSLARRLKIGSEIASHDTLLDPKNPYNCLQLMDIGKIAISGFSEPNQK